MDDILENATFILLLSKEIGEDWIDLGRFLSLKDPELDEIDHDYDRLGEKAYRMISLWRDQQKHPRLVVLANALYLAKRIDLIKMIESKTKKSFGYKEMKPTSEDKAVQVRETAESVKVNVVEPVIGKGMFIDELMVASDANDNFPIEKYYLSPNYNLFSDDLLDISVKQMLSDTVIHTMQKMITGICGLQDPVLGQNLLFNKQKGSFVQVLHDGDAHWLAISTNGCSVSEVFILDSMFRGKVKNHVIQQICAIMHCTEDILTVRVVPVQQQTNNVDCGLYALAFVKYIADTGSNPSYVAFDDSQMRKHLLQCVKGNQFNAFPKSETALRFCKEKDIQFSLYCICRQVWLASDKCVKERLQNVPTNLEAHLIEEVRKFPCLWDTTTCAYKETPLKVEAWRQISTLLNVEEKTLTSAWAKLRENFRCLNCQKKTTMSGAGDPVEHQALENIHNSIRASSSRDNLTLTENEAVINSTSSPQMIISSPNHMKRKMKIDPLKVALKIATMNDVEQNKLKINENADELFCKSLISSFHKLSRKKNKIAKIKVMEILLEMESDNE